MFDVATAAAGHFKAGYNCSQSVLLALCGRHGLAEELAARLATGFGVGMGRGETCGAVTGAIMALGLFGGGGGPDGAAAKAETYARVQEFYRRFGDRHGSLVCQDLIGLDPSSPEGLAQAKRDGRFQTVCVELVKNAAATAEAVMAEAAGQKA